ncbi:PAS domain S-box protein [Leptolyngbya sp. FACHB-261]|uniref:PAS domain S-box protein n=1 Tax=Leptolyngbya sp. FACHB-261 TaxID=2692806 RepID=UPI001685981C|nr:PAS domain S-box protein [Leptolyngbya sp. FACHB-261]MBD2104765.1 PAS domain S-box protein [Leptolyngbya sp. FACHB-261]
MNELKSLRTQLETSQQSYCGCLGKADIGLALCRLDGTLVDINLGYAAILGYTVEEALTLNCKNITPEKYVEQELAAFQELKRTGLYGPYEKEYIHKDGHLVPVRISGLLLEQNGERLICCSVENLTPTANESPCEIQLQPEAATNTKKPAQAGQKTNR